MNDPWEEHAATPVEAQARANAALDRAVTAIREDKLAEYVTVVGVSTNKTQFGALNAYAPSPNGLARIMGPIIMMMRQHFSFGSRLKIAWSILFARSLPGMNTQTRSED